jgi:hypothetical protein
MMLVHVTRIRTRQDFLGCAANSFVAVFTLTPCFSPLLFSSWEKGPSLTAKVAHRRKSMVARLRRGREPSQQGSFRAIRVTSCNFVRGIISCLKGFAVSCFSFPSQASSDDKYPYFVGRTPFDHLKCRHGQYLGQSLPQESCGRPLHSQYTFTSSRFPSPLVA